MARERANNKRLTVIFISIKLRESLRHVDEIGLFTYINEVFIIAQIYIIEK
jgi:hypothetical protein